VPLTSRDIRASYGDAAAELAAASDIAVPPDFGLHGHRGGEHRRRNGGPSKPQTVDVCMLRFLANSIAPDWVGRVRERWAGGI
jgi:hypothetical protein